MKEGTYIFDDEFFRKYHQDNPDAILIGEDGIPRRPACWSPYFWIMVKTWKDAIKEHRSKPEVVLQANHINKNTFLWHRFFYDDLLKSGKDLNLGKENTKHPTIEYKEQTPCRRLEKDDENSLLDYINKNLEKLGQETFSKLSDLPKEISFSDTYWNNDIVCNFQQFIFPKTVYFENVEIDITANFSKSIFLDEVDFTGTKFLKGANFHDSQFSKKVSFIGNKFSQEANFEGTEFEAQVDFSQAKFQGYTRFDNIRCAEDANFYKSEFSKEVDFSQAKFQGYTCFDNIRCAEDANFYKSEFGKKTSFSQAVFQGNANFRETKFKEEAYFGEATFEGEVNFDLPKTNKQPIESAKVIFYENVSFKKAHFQDDALFHNIIIGGKADFESASFDKYTNFEKVQFKNQAIFNNAQFQKDSTARFDDITCAGEFNFSNVDCHPRFFLTRANLREASLNFEGAYFRDGMNLDSIACPEQAGDTEIHRLSWRELRNIAASKGDAKQELDFLAYELQARQKNEKDENSSVRFMIKAYGWFSDYGRSIASPIKSWFLLIFIFFSIYGFIFFICALFIYNDQYRYRITLPHALKASSAFALSFYEGSVFLPIADAERYQYLKTQLFTLDCALIKKELQKEYCSPKSDNPKEQSYLMENAYYYYYPMVAGFQKLFSLLLILLLGNSIRNHLRMR